MKLNFLNTTCQVHARPRAPIRQSRRSELPFLWLLCPITLLTSPFGFKALFEGRSIASSVAETSEITVRNIHFLSPPPKEGLNLVTIKRRLWLANTSLSYIDGGVL